jgi:hypothetical protein
MERDTRLAIQNVAVLLATSATILGLYYMGAENFSAVGLGCMFGFTWLSSD